MTITKEIFDLIQPGEIFRTVTTKYQRVERPLEWELTFVCVRGRTPEHPSWAIYCEFPDKSPEWIKNNGNKIHSEDIIKSICPCDDEVFKLYRY